jgi:hypothetical protein
VSSSRRGARNSAERYEISFQLKFISFCVKKSMAAVKQHNTFHYAHEEKNFGKFADLLKKLKRFLRVELERN